MHSETDIIAKAWLTIEVCNLVLVNDNLKVDKIFLIGSYASGKQTLHSDLDFLIQLRGGLRQGQYYPSWQQIEAIQIKLGRRTHVVFGTQEAAERLHQTHKNEVKNYKYREIPQGGTLAYTRSSILSQ